MDEKGNVASAEAISGPLLLRSAAVEAAWQWKFEPTVVNGMPRKVTGMPEFNFTLN